MNLYQEQDLVPLQPATYSGKVEKRYGILQKKEERMNKLKLLIIKPNDKKETIYKNLTKYLEQQGITVSKGGKNDK